MSRILRCTWGRTGHCDRNDSLVAASTPHTKWKRDQCRWLYKTYRAGFLRVQVNSLSFVQRSSLPPLCSSCCSHFPSGCNSGGAVSVAMADAGERVPCHPLAHPTLPSSWWDGSGRASWPWIRSPTGAADRLIYQSNGGARSFP